ncbi:hypothetical protein PV08_09554 [Exophiala spinifera]|uniref:DUF7587 domain-containing protein n=1 Tax=Exophiala spinifera TaxID=91928 RepID=A0A0D1ZH65_9EURO|nr:uncharacterized protein PV08_09554 [Exophiala spinifera]KIW12277.1 hypothetical protein PV08_09554 [Exophiala spinifera]
MENDATFNSGIVSGLLYPLLRTVFQPEEDRHPWRGRRQPFDRPLLRLWDGQSGSQPDPNGRMRSREGRGRLDSFRSRKDSLTIHINHRNWTPTPYISFTDSSSEIESLARLRTRRGRGPFTLTVIDPDKRVRNGLPVLNVRDEMEEYNVPDPYASVEYNDHYICLWEVTADEFVGNWNYNDLIIHKNWLQEIIIPAFWRARQVMRVGGLSNLFNRLSLSTDASDSTNFSHEGFQSSTEELAWDFDDELENEHNDSDDAHYPLSDKSGSDKHDEGEEA